MRTRPIIAIDGPSGAGKSTVSRRVATELGFTYIDTGAMYRCVALLAKRGGLPVADSPALRELLRPIRIEFGAASGGEQRVLCNGEDVSAAIREHEISGLASALSALPVVRERLVELQREMGRDGGVIMEGRDITTNVFPDAELKVFLTASADERAKRRHLELAAKGDAPDLASVLRDQARRDEADSTRAANPLRRADDALFMDTSVMDIGLVVSNIVLLARKIMQGRERA
ncbi:MAG: (d)CMP kinase [Deltaproteobacteria bacterium]|nr:(d)CMP kinase [Deltaproteobacteria bacterium]